MRGRGPTASVRLLRRRPRQILFSPRPEETWLQKVWNRHNPYAIDELVSPHYLNYAAGSAEYQHGSARRAVEWLLSAFSDHRFDVEDAAADWETVALRDTCSGTHEGELLGIAPTGKRFAAQQWH